MSHPIPHTGRPRRFRRKGKGGVSANSRILPGRFPDEGDKGPRHRRQVRRVEARLWRAEAYDLAY